MPVLIIVAEFGPDRIADPSGYHKQQSKSTKGHLIGLFKKHLLGIHTISIVFVPDFPLISLAFKFLALSKVRVKMLLLG